MKNKTERFSWSFQDVEIWCRLIIGSVSLALIPWQPNAAANAAVCNKIQIASSQLDTVAVMPFQNATNDPSLDWLSMGIPETITDDLLTMGGFVLIERIQLWRVMEEQALQLTGAIDNATAMEIGKLLGANLLVVGAFQKQGDTVRLTARFVEAQTGGVLQSTKITGSIDNIFDLQDRIVEDLAVGLNLGVARTKSTTPRRRPTKSLEAFQHFGQATLLQARKDYQGAVGELQKAIAVDPGFSLARDYLMEEFFPLEEGNYWEYEITVSQAAAGESRAVYIHRASDPEESDGKQHYALTLETTEDVGARNMRTPSVEYYEKGDDGIYLVGRLINPDANPQVRELYDPPVLLFPYELKMGKQWTAQYRVRTTGQPGESSIQRRQYTITGKENIKIPSLGSLQCYVIQEDQRPGGSGESSKTWFAPGIGIVKTFWQSAEKSPLETPRMRTQVLTAFHIER